MLWEPILGKGELLTGEAVILSVMGYSLEGVLVCTIGSDLKGMAW